MPDSLVAENRIARRQPAAGRSGNRRGRKHWALALLLLLAAAVFAVYSARILVIDAPARADAIVVLAGDENDERFRRALELLRAGYAPRLLLDARADVIHYGHSPAENAAAFLRESAPLAPNRELAVCPFTRNSTRDESLGVLRCLAPLGVHRVLLVTSDYHTRRALSIAGHYMPQYQWSVAAARNDSDFGVHWWRRREWAKTNILEWQRLIWWTLVDRWRNR